MNTNNNKIILRGARVIDPYNNIDQIKDIAIHNQQIVNPQTIPDAQIINLENKIVAPGFIDIHVHLRDPGQTYKENITSGTRAAAQGGFTTIIAMPNTTPAIDSVEQLKQQQQNIKNNAIIRVLQSAAITKNRNGKDLTDPQTLKEAGAILLTDDGTTIQKPAIMLKAMQQAQQAGLIISDHCEEESIAAQGVMNQGECAKHLKMPSKSTLAEELIVARNALLSLETNCPIHIQHISSKRSIELIQYFRSQGVKITAEATPHHICLTDEACAEYGANAKMNPPLCTEADRQAIIQALVDNTISCIATDHAPHTENEKSAGLINAPFGIVGLETAISLCLTELYHTKILSLPNLIAKFTAGPKKLLNLPYGSLQIGDPADITIIDTQVQYHINTQNFQSLSKNCPYNNWKCQGKAIATMVAGEWIMYNSQLQK